MIAWIDIETTGLHPMCSIIELACIVTDDSFNEVTSYETLIHPHFGAIVETGALEMHKKSGLWDEVMNSSKIIKEVERELSHLLSGIHKDGKFEKLVLAGSSVHFDRGFIESCLPKSAAYLHYRNFDVSSLKLFCQYAYGADPEELPARKSESKHRAMDDIRASIDAAKWYRDNLIYIPNLPSRQLSHADNMPSGPWDEDAYDRGGRRYG